MKEIRKIVYIISLPLLLPIMLIFGISIVLAQGVTWFWEVLVEITKEELNK